MKTGYRIPEDHKGCKYLASWWEDVAGDGGSRMQMEECAYDGDKQTSDNCDKNCLAFEKEETVICKKHDHEFLVSDFCPECYTEDVMLNDIKMSQYGN